MLEFSLTADQLSAWAAGDQTAVEAAVVGPDVAVDAAADVAGALTATFTDARVRTRLQLRANGEEQVFDGWIGPALVFTVPAGDGSTAVATGPITALPGLVARLVGLGPRVYDPSSPPIPLPRAMLEATAGIGAPEAFMTALHDQFDDQLPADALDALVDGAALRWTLTAWTDADQDAPETCVDVIDARERGQWIITPGPDDETVVAAPSTTTGVWVLLSSVLGSAVAPSAASA